MPGIPSPALLEVGVGEVILDSSFAVLGGIQFRFLTSVPQPHAVILLCDELL